MSGILFDASDPRHLLSRESLKPAMAKADLSDREKRSKYGQMLKQVAQILGKTRKEIADVLKVDEGQLGRWYSGEENPQMWRYHALDDIGNGMSLRDALRIAEAEDARADGVSVRTIIEMVR